VGTYDGRFTSIYIDGQLAARNQVQGGSIVYPDEQYPATMFHIGAYKDADEFFPMVGKIHSVYDLCRMPDAAIPLCDV